MSFYLIVPLRSVLEVRTYCSTVNGYSRNRFYAKSTNMYKCDNNYSFSMFLLVRAHIYCFTTFCQGIHTSVGKQNYVIKNQQKNQFTARILLYRFLIFNYIKTYILIWQTMADSDTELLIDPNDSDANSNATSSVSKRVGTQ